VKSVAKSATSVLVEQLVVKEAAVVTTVVDVAVVTAVRAVTADSSAHNLVTL
jgi:hypothetical protein